MCNRKRQKKGIFIYVGRNKELKYEAFLISDIKIKHTMQTNLTEVNVNVQRIQFKKHF